MKGHNSSPWDLRDMLMKYKLVKGIKLRHHWVMSVIISMFLKLSGLGLYNSGATLVIPPTFDSL